MGVAISTWELAKVVSREKCLGVVSGTGLGMILIARLMEGDVDGHFRRALAHFPFQEPVKSAHKIVKKSMGRRSRNAILFSDFYDKMPFQDFKK